LFRGYQLISGKAPSWPPLVKKHFFHLHSCDMKMKMKMSSGVQVALGLGALVIIYLVVKNNQASAAANASAAASPQLVPIGGGSPISNAGMVAIDVQPPLVPLQITLN
jgi:hypothetical protein